MKNKSLYIIAAIAALGIVGGGCYMLGVHSTSSNDLPVQNPIELTEPESTESAEEIAADEQTVADKQADADKETVADKESPIVSGAKDAEIAKLLNDAEEWVKSYEFRAKECVQNGGDLSMGFSEVYRNVEENFEKIEAVKDRLTKEQKERFDELQRRHAISCEVIEFATCDH